MKKKQHLQVEVILPMCTKHLPEAHEQSAARILAERFNCKVEFIPEHTGYKVKTADIVMNSVEWEIKSPTGNSRSTIETCIKKAKRQSKSIIIDLRRTRLTKEHVVKELVGHNIHTKSMKRLLLIDKDEIVHTLK